MTETITGSEALMRALQDEGVETIFGYPGGAIMPVFDELYNYTQGNNPPFRHILVRHEQAAAHAAEGYARVSGKVGVCNEFVVHALHAHKRIENRHVPFKSSTRSDSVKFLWVTPLFWAGISRERAGRRFSPVMRGLAI